MAIKVTQRHVLMRGLLRQGHNPNLPRDVESIQPNLINASSLPHWIYQLLIVRDLLVCTVCST
jgi:hypothetical protein